MAEQQAKVVRDRFVLRKPFLRGRLWYVKVRDLETDSVHKVATKQTKRTAAEQYILKWCDERIAKEKKKPRKAKLFRVAFEEYLDLEKADVRESTRVVYRTDFRGVYKPAFGERYVGDVQVGDIERFLADMAKAGRSARTRKKHLTMLRSFWRWAVRRRYALENPCEGIRVGRGEKREAVALSVEECGRLLAACRAARILTVRDKRRREFKQSFPPPAHLFVSVAASLYTGLRQSNVLGLRWRHVDLGARALTFSPEEMKGKRGLRVPIHRDLDRVLRDVLRAGEKRPDPEDPVIGAQLSGLRKGFQTALDRGEMPPGVTWHGLRHTFATIMAPLCSFACLRELLGHSPGNVVTLHYTHVPWEERLEAVDRFPSLLGSSLAEETASPAVRS